MSNHATLLNVKDLLYVQIALVVLIEKSKSTNVTQWLCGIVSKVGSTLAVQAAVCLGSLGGVDITHQHLSCCNPYHPPDEKL